MKKISFGLYCLFFLAFSSCNKHELAPSADKKIEVVESSKEQTQSSQLLSDSQWVPEIPYPTAISFTDIFKNDKNILEQLIISNNQESATIYIRNLASQICGYFYYNRNIDIRNDFINDPNGVILLGLFYAADEYYYQNQMTAKSLKQSGKTASPNLYDDPDPMGCFLTAVGSLIGFADAKNIWRSFVAGASEQTVIAALKLIGRRVATVITVVVTIYQAGECLDWW